MSTPGRLRVLMALLQLSLVAVAVWLLVQGGTSGEGFQVGLVVRLLVILGWGLVPLMAWWQQPTPALRVLMLLGAGVALGLSGLPYPPDTAADRVWVSLRHAIVLAAVAAGVHFVLRTPERPFLAEMGTSWLYFPVAVFWALMLWRVWLPVSPEHPVVMISRVGGAVLMLLYVTGALMLMSRQAAREWLGGEPADGWRLLLGLLCGLLPLAAAAILGAFSSEAGQWLLAWSPLGLLWVVWIWSRLGQNRAKSAL